jgi:20S proteasome alpha/beta subunit
MIAPSVGKEIRFPPPWRKWMTCCVATLCDEGESIVLVSDRMIGTSMIESEPQINKVIVLHKTWRVMLAGNDIAPALPIIENARAILVGTVPSLKEVCDAVYQSYQVERAKLVEAIYLAPRGWTLKDFNSPKASILPESLREEIGTKIAAKKVEVGFIVAGFDDKGRGHIFSIDDYEERGKPRIQDLPGYHAIGSGADAAGYMMAYREVSAKLPLRLALYYAVEGKYFGEQASGVGTKTDVLVMRSGKPSFRVHERTLEDKLFKLCQRLEPRVIRKAHIAVLNSLGVGSTHVAPKLTIKKVRDEWVIEQEEDDNDSPKRSVPQKLKGRR